MPHVKKLIFNEISEQTVHLHDPFVQSPDKAGRAVIPILQILLLKFKEG